MRSEEANIGEQRKKRHMQRKRKKHDIHILRESIAIKNEIRIENFLKEDEWKIS